MNLNKVFNAVSSSGLSAGLAGGAAGGLLTAAITTKGGKKMAKNALQLGGIAAIGGLAWNAYKSYQANNALPPSVNQDSQAQQPAFLSAGLTMTDFSDALDNKAHPSGGLLIVQTMISAAMADNHIDTGESRRIFSEIDRLELSNDEKAVLIDEMNEPKSIHFLCKQVQNPQTAIEVYTAAYVAIDESRPEGAQYLADIASQLELPEALIESVRMRARSPTSLAA
ncbi:MAG: tellurite resistance TerB family protein [Pseudomonadales bacterium]